MGLLIGKQIILGVTGSIAAYKAAELTRLLGKSGAHIRVTMTQGAQAFVTPMTFQALSGNPVHTALLDEQAEAGMGHIELARWADTVVVAPASANFLARLAHGMADDLLSTLCLTTDAPIMVAPAMNQQMWHNHQTRININHLTQSGIAVMGPASGEQACGSIGPGRMLEPEELLSIIDNSFARHILSGLKVMVTAGATREAIDIARYISNRSSGKMGFALATAAREAGAEVTLIAGPVSLNTPEGVSRIDIETAEQMGQAVLNQIASQDILIGSAAVADYVPASPYKGKIKKTHDNLTIELSAGIDIMQEVGQLHNKPFTVGFAAETENIDAHAQDKMRRKNMDMIAANNVGLSDRGFEADENAIDVYWDDGRKTLPLASKDKIARQLVALIGDRYRMTVSGHSGNQRPAI